MLKELEALKINDEGLIPVHLFSVLKSDNSRCGIYHIPQFGFGMEGFPADGSVRTIAHHIATLAGCLDVVQDDDDDEDNYYSFEEKKVVVQSVPPQYVSFEAGVIDPGSLAEDSIIESIVAWMKGADTDDEEFDVVSDVLSGLDEVKVIDDGDI